MTMKQPLGTRQIGSVYQADWEDLFRQHDWVTPLAVSISESIEDLVSLVESCARSVKKKTTTIDKWKTLVTDKLATLTVGPEKFVQFIY